MAVDTITIPRELFERLIEHAHSLQNEWHCSEYADAMRQLDADVKLAVAIRDDKGLPSGD